MMMTTIDNIEVTPTDWIPETDSIIKVLGVSRSAFWIWAPEALLCLCF